MFPPIMFQDIPSFQLQGPKLETKLDTKFLPYSLRAGPRRRPNNVGRSPAVGLRGIASSEAVKKHRDFLPPIQRSGEERTTDGQFSDADIRKV